MFWIEANRPDRIAPSAVARRPASTSPVSLAPRASLGHARPWPGLPARVGARPQYPPPSFVRPPSRSASARRYRHGRRHPRAPRARRRLGARPRAPTCSALPSPTPASSSPPLHHPLRRLLPPRTPTTSSLNSNLTTRAHTHFAHLQAHCENIFLSHLFYLVLAP